MDNRSVDLIVNDLGYNKDGDINSTTAKVANNTNKNLLGKLRWMVLEYDNLRILKIYESDKIIFVLINSNTQLEHTVDNILGYYYESEELPKNLF